MGAAEAAWKPNLQPRTKTDGKKRKKNARNATEFLISVHLGKVWPPLALRDDILYSELLEEFENTGVKEIVRGNSKFRLQRGLIVQHENDQDEVLDY